MSLDDWILALHLLAAFALGAAIVGFWVVIIGARSAERPSATAGMLRLSPPFAAATAIGAIGTVVFGIWLAVSVDGYEVWDGWVIAAIVLWAVGGATGGRAGREFAAIGVRARELAEAGDAPGADLRSSPHFPRAMGLHAVSTAAFLVILVLMIWKPGA
ncbi:MAG TPA: DUF2269 family protein [Miltoncostaeaceae bacterium]|nr:DUF2269 family protein [Miltoncostaeaceae bacterium]